MRTSTWKRMAEWVVLCVILVLLAFGAISLLGFLAGCQARSTVTPGETDIEHEYDRTTIIRVLPRTVNMLVLAPLTINPPNRRQIRVGDRLIELDDSETLEIESRDTGKARGASRGPGMQVTAQDYEGGFDASAPELNLGDNRASGGGIAWSAKIIGGGGLNTMHYFGGLLAAAGVVVLVWLKRMWLGVSLLAAGAVVWAFASAPPWVWTFVTIGVIVLLGGFLLYYLHREGKLTIFRNDVVLGIERLKDSDVSAHEKVKDAIKAEAGPDRHTVIDPEVMAAKAKK